MTEGRIVIPCKYQAQRLDSSKVEQASWAVLLARALGHLHLHFEARQRGDRIDMLYSAVIPGSSVTEGFVIQGVGQQP